MGEKLIDAITKATGLPDHIIRPEIQRLVSDSGFNADELTVDQLREVVADYLQDVILEAKESFS